MKRLFSKWKWGLGFAILSLSAVWSVPAWEYFLNFLGWFLFGCYFGLCVQDMRKRWTGVREKTIKEFLSPWKKVGSIGPLTLEVKKKVEEVPDHKWTELVGSTPLVAFPGDDDLDLDVQIILDSVVPIEGDEMIEVLVQSSSGAGSWIPEDSDRMRGMPHITNLEMSFGFDFRRLDEGAKDRIRGWLDKLYHWSVERTVVHLVSAPGKMSIVINDDNEDFVLIPRANPPTEEETLGS